MSTHECPDCGFGAKSAGGLASHRRACAPSADDVDLGPRGRRLWDALCDKVEGRQGLVMLEESCRIADRLDKLDALLTKSEDVWFRIESRLDETVVEVVVDSPLIEARHQANVLRQVIKDLPMKEAAAPAGRSKRDELEAKRAQRRAAVLESAAGRRK